MNPHRLALGLALTLMTGVFARGAVRTGLDVLMEERLDQLEGKRVGVVCNHTARTADGVHIVDALHGRGIRVTAIWAPEHGFRGTEHTAGSTASDEATGAPIYSLYDDTRAPTAEELARVDVLLFDIQDIGTRFYTYISTMGLVIEAAARAGLPLFILDRPNPISGRHPEGAIAEPEILRGFTSFYPIPTRHALTVGELARMAVGEGWLDLPEDTEPDLTVIPCDGWTRTMDGDALGRAWVKPSPNIPGTESALLYAGQGFWEGTNIQEGRGTDIPFQLCGAPWVSPEAYAARLSALGLPGVHFQPITYVPVPNAGVPARYLKFNGQAVGGVMITVLDREVFRPVRTGLAMVWTLTEMYPDRVTFTNGLRTLTGSQAVRDALEALKAGNPPAGGWQAIADAWEGPVQEYWERAQPYLLYE